MSKLNACNQPLYYSGLTVKISESLTDIEWTVLERRFIYKDSLDTIGSHLGRAREGVVHIKNKALDDLIKVLNEEIECFSIRLAQLLSNAERALTIKECMVAFPNISETEFNIMFAVCQKAREGVFNRDRDSIAISGSDHE